MGFLGSKSGLTPNLDKFASQSAVFTNAFSQVPLTTASHATILTGTYPQYHKVNDAGVALGKDLPYAPAILRLRGYQTAAFVGSVILDPKAGAPGFDRGFTKYDAGFHSRRPGEDRYTTVERRGDEVVAHALQWLKQRPRSQPFFLWVHLYDPHAPYDPPEPYRSRFLSQPYDGEIAYTDAAVGKLLDELRAEKLYDDAVFAVMADHGEALGEHGERGHGIFLYAPTIHVPLIIKLPGTAPSTVAARVELVDVLPTVLEAANLPVPKTVQGASLVPLLEKTHAARNNDRPAYAETDYPHRAYGWSSLRSLRTGKYLFIDAPRKELYDQTVDEADAHDLSTASGAVTATLAAQLDKFRRETSSTRAAVSGPLDPQQAERLRALGYVASSDTNSKPAEVSGIDPKDKIEIANLMTDAIFAEEEGQYRQAVNLLENVVAKDPTLAPAYAQLGGILSSMGDLGHAVPALQKAVALRPDSVSAHYGLGMALFQSGDLQGAAPQFEAAVAGNPGSAAMHYSLASVYVRINRMDDARRQLQASLKIKPNDYEANKMLGQVFLVQKTPAQALPYLQKAAKLQPDAADIHALLADAYTQLGQKENAAHEHALAQK
jgi:choline-sulfatase